MADQEPTTDVAEDVAAEPELFAELRDALELLRDRSEDDEFRTLVDEVLGGRRSLTEAATTPAFGSALVTMLGGSVDDACAGHPADGDPCAPADGTDAASRCAGCAGLCALRDGAQN